MMKLITTAFFIAFGIGLYSQVIEDEFPNYQGVINVEGKSQKEIYGLLKQWVGKTYNDADKVTQADDPDNGSMVIKALHKFTAKGVVVKCDYNLTLDSKDGKFRYTFTYLDVNDGGTHPTMTNLLLADPPIKANGKPFTGGGLKYMLKRKEEYLQNLFLFKDSMVSKLNQASEVKNSDW